MWFLLLSYFTSFATALKEKSWRKNKEGIEEDEFYNAKLWFWSKQDSKSNCQRQEPHTTHAAFQISSINTFSPKSSSTESVGVLLVSHLSYYCWAEMKMRTPRTNTQISCWPPSPLMKKQKETARFHPDSDDKVLGSIICSSGQFSLHSC